MAYQLLQFTFYAVKHTTVALIQTKVKVKSKTVPLLFLTEHHAMKPYWGSGGTAPPIDLGTRRS
jgi:hypothetical protein